MEAVKVKFYCFLGIVNPTVYNTVGEPDYILPEKICNVLHFRTKQGKICLRQVHINQGGQNVKMSGQAIQGASSENS